MTSQSNSIIHNSLSPLSWLLTIFCINISKESGKKSHPLFNILKMIFMATLFGCISAFSAYYKMLNIYQYLNRSIVLTDVLEMIYDYCQLLVDMLLVNKYRHMSVQYFKQYEIIDKILNISDLSEIKWRLTKLVSFFVIFWFVVSASDFSAWVSCYGLVANTAYLITYVYLLCSIATTLDLTSNVMQIEIRLNIMEDVVKHIYSTSEALPGLLSDTNRKRFGFSTNDRITAISSHVFTKENCDLKVMSRCYLLLTDQVDVINKIFGFRIVINSLSLLIDMIRFNNVGIRILMGTQLTAFDLKYYPAITCLLRVATSAGVFVSLVKHCESVYSTHKNIVSNIDRLLINKIPDEKIRLCTSELRNFMLARPIKFNMWDFIELNNSFLISIASVVVTYTIILLQN